MVFAKTEARQRGSMDKVKFIVVLGQCIAAPVSAVAGNQVVESPEPPGNNGVNTIPVAGAGFTMSDPARRCSLKRRQGA